MYNINVGRRQFAIGQGGFHHTQVHCWHTSNNFSVVYDCGGADSSHRASLVKAFAGAGARRHDWLVISHLDLDHISGVPQLHAHGQTFEHVILPHLDEKAREKYFQWMAFAALAQGHDAAEVRAGVGVARGLYAGTYGPPVMVVHRDGEQGEQEQNPGQAAQPALSLPLAAARAIAAGELPDGITLSLAKVDWQFRFYSREWDSSRIDAVWGLAVLAPLKALIARMGALGSGGLASWKVEVIDALKATIPKADCDAALKAIDPAQAATGDMTLKSLIGSLYALSELHHYNSASLCMYSGPRERGSDHVRAGFNRQVHGLALHEAARLEPLRLTRSVGWLGTGDAHFQDLKAVEHFANHFLVELPRVSTVVVPHHGSRHNYGKDDLGPLLALMARLALGVRLFVVPAKRSVYGHPHDEVERALSRADVVQVVSEAMLSQLDESVSTGWS